ncbi:MAG: hypothetical protein AABW63_00410 [Nanoarchaeota archaeon]
MALGATIFIIIVLIAAIWITLEFKRARHKIFAIFLIALILFTYFSFTTAIKGQNVDLGSTSGMVKAVGLYFGWLGHLFGNLKTITANAVRMDWNNNNSTTGK